MKKILLTSLCGLAMVGAAFAQGNVTWVTLSPANITAQTNATVYSSFTGGGSTGGGSIGNVSGNTLVGQGFYFTILYQASATQLSAPTSFASLQSWSSSGLMATNNANSAGRLAPVSPSGGVTVPWGPTADSIMLVGWSANLGTTWAEALAAMMSGNYGAGSYFGESATGFSGTASTSASPGASLFGSAATAFGTPIQSLNTPLYLLAVPEPGTMALAGLGGLSLLAFRRKK